MQSILSALVQNAALRLGPLPNVLASSAVEKVDAQLLQRLLLAYYRILHANRTLPHTLGWSLTPLSQLIWTPHPNNGVRLLAIKCYALQAGMMEGERVKLEQEVVGDVKETECPIFFAYNLDGTVREVDGWVLPTLELERISRARDALLDYEDVFGHDGFDSTEPIHPAELRYVPVLFIHTLQNLSIIIQSIGCEHPWRSDAPLFCGNKRTHATHRYAYDYTSSPQCRPASIYTTTDYPHISTFVREILVGVTHGATPPPRLPQSHRLDPLGRHVSRSSIAIGILCLFTYTARNLRMEGGRTRSCDARRKMGGIRGY